MCTVWPLVAFDLTEYKKKREKLLSGIYLPSLKFMQTRHGELSCLDARASSHVITILQADVASIYQGCINKSHTTGL